MNRWKNNMRIVLITDLFFPNVGGVESVVYNLATEFAAKNHNVTVIAAKTPRDLPSYEIINGIDVYRLHFILPTLRLKSILGFFSIGIITNLKLIWLLRKIKPDIVNTHFVYANGFYTLLSKLLLKYPLMVSVHGNDVQKYPYESRICKIILSNILERADAITACSASLLKETSLIRKKPNKVFCPIPNGIDVKEFKINTKYIHPRPYLFSMGRFVHKKGFDILINAFKIVTLKKDNIDLIIAGKGDEWENCSKLIDELNLAKRVKLLGFVERNEVVKLYVGCEFFILPSRREPFGITNIEAMAAGKTIIASDVDGVPEIIKNGENGILFKSESIDELAEKILWLFENNEIKENMGRKGKLMAEKDYNWQSIANSYINIYETILRR